jgi:ABC-2 type transport system ATP-binding protein
MNLFTAKNVSKAYSNNSFKLNDVSFNLQSGKISGVVGENGNGKTTLLRIVAGDLSFDTGEVTYFGESSINSIGWETIKSRVAYIPQRIPRWYGGLRDNLIFEASIRNIKGSKADVVIDDLVEKLGLSEYIHLNWSEISTGYRLRFQLAKMLIGSPDLLVLDEPIANLDINAQNKFLADLRAIVSEENRNVSVILSSQQLHEIENVADSVIFLKAGKLVYAGDVNKIGETRSENEFELQGDFDMHFLQKCFPKIVIKQIAKTFHVKVPLEITSSDFIKTIITQQKSLHYFRDISSSTRKLFNQ